MNIKVDVNDPRPLYLQLAVTMRQKIAEGEWIADGKLPTSAELAASVGVNHNTALRALHLLRREGLVEFRRGRPAMVNHDVGPSKLSTLADAHRSIVLAVEAGFSRQNLLALVEEAFADSRELNGG